MSRLAKSVDNKVQIIKVNSEREFLDAFNKSRPADEILELSIQALELFGESDDKQLQSLKPWV